MTGRIRACSGHERTVLADDWEFAAGETPGREWRRAQVPGTVASSLRSLGSWSLDDPPRDFDADDWWYRLRFNAVPAADGERLVLGFEGLATLAHVWLNGVPLLESNNMFVGHECDVTASLRPANELLIRCRSLAVELKTRRARARWRTPMVANQQLRWIRTSLLGRTPGWSPPAAPVGPWRPVWLERRRLVDLDDVRVRAGVDQDRGMVSFSCELAPIGDVAVQSASLVAEAGDQRFEGRLTLRHDAKGVEGCLPIANVRRWWPHTHGEPALYRVRLELTVRRADTGEAAAVVAELGSVGFRELSLDRTDGDFALAVNGRAVFCRGACWTPPDCVSLQASAEDYRDALAVARAAGINMLRVAGPLVYESDEFLDLCDAEGILIWQDFMFANMDYPADDAAFCADVEREARQQLLRLQARPALAVLCGNSEAGQQAAMSGAARDCWRPRLFEDGLATLSARICPDVPYCPSSTHGGAFPHESGAGVASYYGVGAYRLPLTDARRAEVRFASECLAFANVPEDETLALLSADQPIRCHHPRWKERVPRDRGAGWDFDDIRDHYLTQIYRLDPMALRYAEHDRYLRLSRAVSGDVMAACFAEWRRARSGCRGALVWFLRDLWPGAGWGIVDSTGLPKAPYFHLKRVLQPLLLAISDEGTNGLKIHVVNEGPARPAMRLEVALFRRSEPVGVGVSHDLDIGAAAGIELSAADLYEGFMDLSYAYRFGAPAYDVMHARLLRDDAKTIVAEAFHFPLGPPNGVEDDIGLTAVASRRGDGALEVRVRCKKFAQSVHLETPGFVADDQYFHMAPNACRLVTLRPRAASPPARLDGTIHALNSSRIDRIVPAS